jgi:PPOX class probable F420-dependent enzyme
MPGDLEGVRQIAAGAKHLAVVATTRRDGTIHASLVSAGVIDDPVSDEPSIGIVVGGSTAKLRLLRRSKRAAVVFQAGFNWVTIEGPVRIAGPDDVDAGIAGDSIPALLRSVFVAAGGSHENWAEFDRVMAAERRAAVFVRVDRISSNG